MKFILSILILVSLAFNVSAQKEDRNWVFGINAGIDFNDVQNPKTFTSVRRVEEVSAAISTKNGELLFYLTNQDWASYSPMMIVDKNGTPIVNGDSLFAHVSSTNGAVIVPAVDDSSKYYLFYTGVYNLTNCSIYACYYLYYSVIHYNHGILEVSQKNIPIVQENVEERLAAVKHGNGKDWWIISHQSGSRFGCTKRFYKVLLTKNGPLFNAHQDIGVLHCADYCPVGELAFTRDGTLAASAIGGQGVIDLLSFDRCSGEFYNSFTIDISDVLLHPYSCEFSPSQNALYISGWKDPNFNFSGLYQYDLTVSNIETSRITIWESEQFLDVGQLQIAPDNKMYYSSWFIWDQTPYVENKNLSVINSPDSVGLSCDFRPFSFYVGDSSWTSYALPNNPNYNLGPVGIFSFQAGALDTITFCSEQTTRIMLGGEKVRDVNATYAWSPSMFLNDSTIANPVASPTEDTWFYVTITDVNTSGPCGIHTDSVFVKVIDSCSNTAVTHLSSLSLNVYPNPVDETLFVSVVNKQHVVRAITIVDLNGREVLQSAETTVSVSSLPVGLYFVRVTFTNGQSVVRKIVVQARATLR